MATSKATILQRLKDYMKLKGADVGITITPDNWSRTDYKSLQFEAIAEEGAIQEQLYDQFTIDQELIAQRASPQTAQWFQWQMLNLFEYDATDVPIVQLKLPELYPYYTSPNPNYRIITFCSVVKGVAGTTLIKVAKGTTPTVLTSPELSSAQSFVNIIGIDGLNYNVVSYLADRLYIDAEIFYNGLYSAVISDTVIAAITTFLASIPFNGSVELGSLLAAIRSVEGVNRVVFNNIQARADSTAYGSGTNMVQTKAWIQDVWPTYAGYIIPEDTVTHTLADSLTFTAE